MEAIDKQKSWFISFGFIPIPKESMYQEYGKTPTLSEYPGASKKPRKKTKKVDWTAIKRSLRRLEKAIYVLFRREDIITLSEMYEILLEKGFVPPTIYGDVMGLDRFEFYYHRVRKNYGFKTAKKYKIEYIRKNLNGSPETIAEKLNTTAKYVRQQMSRINRGLL